MRRILREWRLALIAALVGLVFLLSTLKVEDQANLDCIKLDRLNTAIIGIVERDEGTVANNLYFLSKDPLLVQKIRALDARALHDLRGATC